MNRIFIIVFIILIAGCNQNDIGKNIARAVEKSSAQVLETKTIASESKKDSGVNANVSVSKSDKENKAVASENENKRLGECFTIANAIIAVVGFSHPDYSLGSVKNTEGELIGYAVILDDSGLNFQGDQKDSFKILLDESQL